MTHVSIIPSHTIGAWLLQHIDSLLDHLGFASHRTAEQIIYFAIIVGVSVGLGWLLRRLILLVTRKAVKMRNSEIGRELLRERAFTKCSHFIPPLVFLSLAPIAFDGTSPLLKMILNIAFMYLVCTFAIGINAVLTFIFQRYNYKENTKNLPLKGILNVAKGLVWIVALIFIVSLILHKSPAALLGGMTAFAAVLMLIFKDSIQGLVAGVQMSGNDMLRVGDWIVVPSTLANGVVEDVTLTTVKVRNFDNTTVMVPPYTLVSASFQNWRSMQESGVRRVAESIYINPDSITAATDELIQGAVEKYPALKPFVDGLRAKGASLAWNAGNAPLNGTLETNLGLFRAYIMSYMLGSDMTDKTKDMMVSIQPMSPEGVPLQVYCFAVTTQWEAYEGVRSALLEHILLASNDFGLEILSADHLQIEQVK